MWELNQRNKAKRAITLQVLDRDLTLFEAAAWFGYLNECPGECPDLYRALVPGATNEEKLCRQVILWVRIEGKSALPPGQAEQEAQNLEEMLAAHLARHGKVILPDL